MARYHFNSHNGGEHRDHEGTELPDHRRARAEALKSIGHTLIQEAEHLGEALSMEVTNDQGLDLYHLNFEITACPAIKFAG